MKKNTCFLLVMLLGISQYTFSQETIDLFIFAGQSNAMGLKGDGNYYPHDDIDNSIRLNHTLMRAGNFSNPFSTDGWTTMQIQDGYEVPLIGGCINEEVGHFGPEVTFSRHLKNASYNPAIFKFGRGSTSLYDEWMGYDPNNPGTELLYDEMISRLQDAITELEAQNHTVNIRGFVWIQGEHDAEVKEATQEDPAVDAKPDLYYQRLSKLINDVRTFAGNSNLPVILGVDEQHGNVIEYPAVHNAHQKIADEDSNVKFTSMVGLLKADNSHLAPDGLIEHGKVLFDNFQLLTGNTTTGNINSESNANQTVFNSGGNLRYASTGRISWGQSFKPNHFGKMLSFEFNSETAINSPFTLTIHNGADCEGVINNNGNVEETPIHTQTISSLVAGDNNIIISEDVFLDREHTYYVDITSNNGVIWKAQYSNSDEVYGSLRANNNNNTSACGRSFLDLDLSYRTVIEPDEVLNNNTIQQFVSNTNIYPNPTDSFVYIRLNQLENAQVKVLSMNGSIVYQLNDINESTHLLDLSFLESGMYLVQITSQGYQKNHKLIVK